MGMNVYNHSNDTCFFQALWSLCRFNHFPAARWSVPSNYTHESRRDRIIEAKVRDALILDVHHQTVSTKQCNMLQENMCKERKSWEVVQQNDN